MDGSGDLFGSGGDDGVPGSGEAKQNQLTEQQTKAMLSELSPKLREELCQVLRKQSEGEERPVMSAELCRILTRFQRRARRAQEETGDETWPMFLGIALFFIISILLVVFWVQDQYEIAEEERENEEDAYWLLREF